MTMKKLFIAIVAFAALTACNKAEIINAPEGEAIAFGNAFVDNATKAATDPSLGTTANPFTSFNVWGTVGTVAIYSGNEVKGTVGSNMVDGKETNLWTCETVKQYWIKDASYKFSALANAGTVTLGNDKLPLKTTFDATNGNIDLLYAEPVSRTGLASGNAAVEFTFNHLLSKVKVTVNNNSQSATGYSFEVRDIVITCPKTGTIDLSSKTWENLSTADAYDAMKIAVDNSIASQECDKELLLIPGSVSINYAVDIKCNGTVIATHTPSAAYTTTIIGGNSYNFIINVAVGEEITFSVDQNPTWSVQPDITVQ
ncbi:MAG: fimbrillin family protein [Bacteroidales bacterium]|nr:fimbrillin family protein [Bacteroidales bacterium]